MFNNSQQNGLTPNQMQMMQQIQQNNQQNQQNQPNRQAMMMQQQSKFPSQWIPQQPMQNQQQQQQQQQTRFPAQWIPQQPMQNQQQQQQQQQTRFPAQWIPQQPMQNQQQQQQQQQTRFPEQWIPQQPNNNQRQMPNFPQQWKPEPTFSMDRNRNMNINPRQGSINNNSTPSWVPPKQFSINPNNYQINDASQTANTHTPAYVTPEAMINTINQDNQRKAQVIQQQLQQQQQQQLQQQQQQLQQQQKQQQQQLQQQQQQQSEPPNFENISDILKKVDNGRGTDEKFVNTMDENYSNEDQIFQGEFLLGSLQFPETSISLKSKFDLAADGIVRIQGIADECVTFTLTKPNIVKITINQEGAKRVLVEDANISYKFYGKKKTQALSLSTLESILEEAESLPSDENNKNREIEEIDLGTSSEFPSISDVKSEVKSAVIDTLITNVDTSSDTDTNGNSDVSVNLK